MSYISIPDPVPDKWVDALEGAIYQVGDFIGDYAGAIGLSIAGALIIGGAIGAGKCAVESRSEYRNNNPDGESFWKIYRKNVEKTFSREERETENVF